MTLIPIASRSVPSLGTEVRLAFNRDESRSRPAAEPPQLRRLGDHLAIMPVDPSSHGTWIGANDSGLICALLNANPAGRARAPGLVSRGAIIPRLLERCATLDQAIREADRLEFAEFAPFRLAVLDRSRVADLEWDGAERRWSGPSPTDRPRMLTSSGLGDDLVRPPREALFRERFDPAAPRDWPRIQDDYHRHSWPEQSRLSVCMRRETAATVSLTVIEADDSAIDWTYYAGPPDMTDEAEMARLLIRRRGD